MEDGTVATRSKSKKKAKNSERERSPRRDTGGLEALGISPPAGTSDEEIHLVEELAFQVDNYTLRLACAAGVLRCAFFFAFVCLPFYVLLC
jgi:hypothetical protein